MNVLQIQDDLKNFSEDQLIKEMQQPSGSAPQFLVLSELNRRKRVKGEFEARQAKNMPTVAEEAISAAGVPQAGMMGMSEAMAPASVESGGIGSMMPKTMKMGGEIDSYAEGGLIEGIADSVSQNTEALQGIQEATLQNSKLLQDQRNTAIQQPQTRPMPVQQPMPMPTPTQQIRSRMPGFGGKGGPIARPAVIDRSRFGMMGFGGSTINPQLRGLGGYRGTLGSGLAALGNRMPEPQSMAEGGVIKAQDGLPDEESYLSKFFGALNPDKETVEKRIAESNPLGFGPVLRSPATDATLEKLEEQEKPTTATTEEKKEDTDAIIDSGADTPTTPKPLTIQEELLKRQAGLAKDRDFDRYMALAQAGLGILASDSPTLAGAVGEGGMKGLDAFREANKRYEEGITDILNARVKLASKNAGLSQKDAISAIGVIDRTISNLRKEAEKSFDETALAKIERDIAQLRFQKRALMPRAGFGYLDIDVSDSTASKG